MERQPSLAPASPRWMAAPAALVPLTCDAAATSTGSVAINVLMLPVMLAFGVGLHAIIARSVKTVLVAARPLANGEPEACGYERHVYHTAAPQMQGVVGTALARGAGAVARLRLAVPAGSARSACSACSARSALDLWWWQRVTASASYLWFQRGFCGHVHQVLIDNILDISVDETEVARLHVAPRAQQRGVPADAAIQRQAHGRAAEDRRAQRRSPTSRRSPTMCARASSRPRTGTRSNRGAGASRAGRRRSGPGERRAKTPTCCSSCVGCARRRCRRTCRPPCRRRCRRNVTDRGPPRARRVTMRRWTRASTSESVRTARARACAAHARRRRRRRDRADRARARAQCRQRSPIPLRQLLPLPDRLRRAAARGWCSTATAAACCSAGRATPSARSGTVIDSGPDAAPAALGVDEAWPVASARREAAGAARAPERGVGPVRRAQRARVAPRGLARSGARTREPRHRMRRRRSATCVCRSTRCGCRRTPPSSQTMRRAARISAGAHARAMRFCAAALRAATRTRRCTSTRSRPSCCTSSAATARSRRRIRASSRPARMPACCTTPPATRRCAPASCA